jgi:hypothetical protein
MTATEIKLEGPYHYCTDCESFTEGAAVKVSAKNVQEAKYVDEDYFFLSVEEWDRMKLVEVTKCGDCGYVCLDPPGENDEPIIQLAAGAHIWECDDCESWYIDQREAERCCT